MLLKNLKNSHKKTIIKLSLKEFMNYENLKILVKYLKDMVKCQGCHKAFKDSEIMLLVTLPADAVFELTCSECKTSVLVNLSMQPVDNNSPIITNNDILDMHNFLQQFNGDFKKLFK